MQESPGGKQKRIDPGRDKERLSRRILMADDSPTTRLIFSSILQESGYEVVAVKNGELLVDKLKKSKEAFDLVITDNSMPFTNDGIHAIKKIREDSRFANLPIILCSGDLGIDPYVLNQLGTTLLPKPIDEDKLKKAVKESLEKRKI